MTKHTVILGDSRRMSELSDDSVHLVVTSPPYWQLKDYGDGRQIGYNDTYSDYINHLGLVWNECYRVLVPGCKLCVNIGDQFARSVYYGGYRVMPIRTQIINFCEARGFDHMGAIIWQKATSMNTTGGGSVMGSYPYPRNGIVKIDYEFILLFKKPGKAPKVDKALKERSKLEKNEWNEYFSGHWTFAGEKQKDHLAMFPMELPRRLIKMYTFCGETVLDPFLGSGTTSAAALELDRNSMGYEINNDYVDTIKSKVGWDKNGGAEFELLLQEAELAPSEVSEMLGTLPYLYKPEREVERQVDPKEKQYGQKIDGDENAEREKYRKVKRVISPEVVELDNYERVRLIGVKEDKAHVHEAKLFLESLVKGSRVYLRQDDAEEFDGDKNRLSYLYLKNRTFVNAHLIRTGYVGVDESWDYRQKTKFLKLSGFNSK